MTLIIEKIDKIFDTQPYLSKLYAAIFITGNYGLLRIGELTKSQHAIKARDVHMAKNKDKMMLVLRSSKTHGVHQKPQIIKLKSENKHLKDRTVARAVRKMICPYKSLREFILVRPKCKQPNEQFFVFSYRSPVKPDHLWRVLHNCLWEIRLDPELYMVHGLRGVVQVTS